MYCSLKAIGLVENQSDWYLGKLWKNHKPWPALVGRDPSHIVELETNRDLKIQDRSEDNHFQNIVVSLSGVAVHPPVMDLIHLVFCQSW